MINRGRPRKFDLELALERAMHVFWRNGFEGASLDDLTAAMGISRPSLYAAFGDKHSLFLQVLDRYRQSPASYVNTALQKPTAFEVFRGLLYGVIDLVTDKRNPGGCLFVCGVLPIGDGSEAVRSELAFRRLSGEKDIISRFQRAVDEGDLPQDTDPKVLGKLAATLMWGMSVQGSSGATKKELTPIAELALNSFPGSSDQNKKA